MRARVLRAHRTNPKTGKPGRGWMTGSREFEDCGEIGRAAAGRRTDTAALRGLISLLCILTGVLLLISGCATRPRPVSYGFQPRFENQSRGQTLVQPPDSN